MNQHRSNTASPTKNNSNNFHYRSGGQMSSPRGGRPSGADGGNVNHEGKKIVVGDTVSIGGHTETSSLTGSNVGSSRTGSDAAREAVAMANAAIQSARNVANMLDHRQVGAGGGGAGGDPKRRHRQQSQHQQQRQQQQQQQQHQQRYPPQNRGFPLGSEVVAIPQQPPKSAPPPPQQVVASPPVVTGQPVLAAAPAAVVRHQPPPPPTRIIAHQPPPTPSRSSAPAISSPTPTASNMSSRVSPGPIVRTPSGSTELDLRHNDNAFHVVANLVTDRLLPKIASPGADSYELNEADRTFIDQMLPGTVRRSFVEALRFRVGLLPSEPRLDETPLMTLTRQCHRLGLGRPDVDNVLLGGSTYISTAGKFVVTNIPPAPPAASQDHRRSDNISLARSARSRSNRSVRTEKNSPGRKHSHSSTNRSLRSSKSQSRSPSNRSHRISGATSPRRSSVASRARQHAGSPTRGMYEPPIERSGSPLGVSSLRSGIQSQRSAAAEEYLSPRQRRLHAEREEQMKALEAREREVQQRMESLQKQQEEFHQKQLEQQQEQIKLQQEQLRKIQQEQQRQMLMHEQSMAQLEMNKREKENLEIEELKKKQRQLLEAHQRELESAKEHQAIQIKESLMQQQREAEEVEKLKKELEAEREHLRSMTTLVSQPTEPPKAFGSMAATSHVGTRGLGVVGDSTSATLGAHHGTGYTSLVNSITATTTPITTTETSSLAKQQVLAEMREAKVLLANSMTPEASSFWRSHVAELEGRLRALETSDGASSLRGMDDDAALRREKLLTSYTSGGDSYTEMSQRKYRADSATLDASVTASVVSVLPIVDVVAPADLPAGFTFEARMGNRRFMATVPEGGVTAGQTFSCPMKSVEKSQIKVPTGIWRDDVFDCFQHGLCHALVCNALVCPLIALGQIMARNSLKWTGYPGNKFQARQACMNMFMIVLFWVAMNCMAMFVIAVKYSRGIDPNLSDIMTLVFINVAMVLYGFYAVANTRLSIRAKYRIPEQRCAGREDYVCSVFCLPCTICQMGRHTSDYDAYDAECCSATGLARNVEVTTTTMDLTTQLENSDAHIV